MAIQVLSLPSFATVSDMNTALGAKAPLNSPNLTGTPTAPTPTAGDTSTKIATMAALAAALAGLVDTAPAAMNTLNELAAAMGSDPNFATTMATALGLKAPLDSPTFTGTPAAPTPAANDNTTKIATTAFVMAAIAALVNSAPSTLDTLNELSVALGNDPNFASSITTLLGAKAPLESPTFTGAPAGPTATANDNTTKLATTAFVNTAISNKLGFEITTATGLTLDAATHNNSRITVTATGQTVTIPSAAALGFFECEIVADGYAVTLDGTGATNVTLADGEVATIFTSNNKVRVVKGPSTVVT